MVELYSLLVLLLIENEHITENGGCTATFYFLCFEVACDLLPMVCQLRGVQVLLACRSYILVVSKVNVNASPTLDCISSRFFFPLKEHSGRVNKHYRIMLRDSASWLLPCAESDRLSN